VVVVCKREIPVLVTLLPAQAKEVAESWVQVISKLRTDGGKVSETDTALFSEIFVEKKEV
jgi:hypothetical protein